MSLINPMASANIMTPAAASINLRENREQNLRSDQVIRATVAEGGLEKVLLQLGGKKYWVPTETPLATGQKVSLQMIETARGMELQLVQTSLADRIRQAIHLVGGRFELLPLLKELTSADHPLFKQLSDPAQNALQAALLFFNGQTEGSDGNFLRSLTRALGFDFEHRLAKGEFAEALASLKGALQEVLQKVGEHDHGLGERIRQLQQMLEACQLFRFKLEQDGIIFLPLPLPFIDYGYLLAERQSHTAEQDHPGSTKISLHLEMSALGPLTLEMLFEGRGLSIRFSSQGRDTSAFIETYREELEDLLEPYNLISLTFSADSIKPQQRLLDILTSDRDRVLNTRV